MVFRDAGSGDRAYEQAYLLQILSVRVSNAELGVWRLVVLCSEAPRRVHGQQGRGHARMLNRMEVIMSWRGIVLDRANDTTQKPRLLVANGIPIWSRRGERFLSCGQSQSASMSC